MSILLEAQDITHGARAQAYGHVLDDFQRTAGMVSAMLAHKLKEPITPDDVTRIMCCVKLSRETNRHGRDNLVDLAGYAWCTQEVMDELARRKELPPISANLKETP